MHHYGTLMTIKFLLLFFYNNYQHHYHNVNWIYLCNMHSNSLSILPTGRLHASLFVMTLSRKQMGKASMALYKRFYFYSSSPRLSLASLTQTKLSRAKAVLVGFHEDACRHAYTYRFFIIIIIAITCFKCLMWFGLVLVCKFLQDI